MDDKEYFSHLYNIASNLNKEFSLPSALRNALETTVKLLELETGWIWLTEGDNKSVYLSASYNLPPALSGHPERLSGRCYCIAQYLSDDIEQAVNISEIKCSRFENVDAGTLGLKFHATIPIIVQGQKVGLMNLLSKESRQLSEKQLFLLNTISELIGMAIQRTRLQESYVDGKHASNPMYDVLNRLLVPQIESIKASLAIAPNTRSVAEARKQLDALQQQVSILKEEIQGQRDEKKAEAMQYPNSPLTVREMEVLALVKKGHTNYQIAEQLFITERTVKFHITSILSKLMAKTRTEAVDIALRRGLLSV